MYICRCKLTANLHAIPVSCGSQDGINNRNSTLKSGLSQSTSKSLFKPMDGPEEDKDDNEQHLPLEVRTARATIKRKYRQLERALEEVSRPHTACPHAVA